MDSLTHLALGSAVGMAVMGRRTKLWKAAAWGAVCHSLPDLDVFINHGDPVSNVTFHRGETHAVFWLTLASPLIAWLVARIQGEANQFRWWWLTVWLLLVLHAVMDLMTTYGTQIALPFTDYPYAIGNVFIIDPAFTLPVLIGAIVALSLRGARGLRWSHGGLVLSGLYLAWSLIAQQIALGIARESLEASHIRTTRIEASPTAFNTILWRVIALTEGGYVEGFYSLLDEEPRMTFDEFPRGDALREPLRDAWHVNRVAWFSHGFYKITERDRRVLISDVRLGQEPYYTFTFLVAERRGDRLVPVTPRFESPGRGAQRLFSWLRERIGGNPVPPPRD